VNKRNKADMELFDANVALQKRSAILARQERAAMLERVLSGLPPCSSHYKVWQHELDKLREELVALGEPWA
jgi:hypothetical protein